MARQSDARVFSPLSVADAIQSLARNPDALVFAGGTSIFRHVPGILLPLSGTIIPIGRIQELKQVNRTERYLDVGACLTASSLCALGPRIAPRILMEAASSIARTPVRCLATIGGNLCVDDRRMDLHAVLAALDAQAEFRGEGQSRWMPLHRIPLKREDPRTGGPEILTRVRIPLETWNAALFRKLGPRDFPDPSTYAFVFLARTARGIVSDIRVLLSGKSVLRRRDIESGLAGKTLPLDRDDVDGIVDAYRKAASEDVVIPELRIAQFLSLLRNALLSLYL
jgi:CO/xanthine dehydrogenase FAD-binding subunit